MKIIDVREGEWAIQPDSAEEIISSERIIQALLIGGMDIEDAEKAESALLAGLEYQTRVSGRKDVIQTLEVVTLAKVA